MESKKATTKKNHAKKTSKRFKADDRVQVTCYRETKEWDRQEAIDFYTEGMFCTEGSESERYRAIVGRLRAGETNVTDEL